MIHWLWLIPAFVGGVYLCALLMGICAAAGREDAWCEGREQGVEEAKAAISAARVEGYNHGMDDTIKAYSGRGREAA